MAFNQLEAGEPRQRHIEHQASRNGSARAGEEFLCGCERLGLPACGSDQQLQRFAHRDVVVDDKNNGRDVRHCYLDRSRGDRRTPSISLSTDLAGAHGRHVYLIRSAASRASSRAASLNGLNRHSTAPCASRRGRMVLSPLAVMKTIGISCCRRINSCCSSGPDMLGIAMSRNRQLVSLTAFDARNASADENAWTAKPNSRSKSGSDSRTDSSSSTTDTSERLPIRDASTRC